MTNGVHRGRCPNCPHGLDEHVEGLCSKCICVGTLARLELDLSVDGAQWARSRRSDARALQDLRASVRAYVAELNRAPPARSVPS